MSDVSMVTGVQWVNPATGTGDCRRGVRPPADRRAGIGSGSTDMPEVEQQPSNGFYIRSWEPLPTVCRGTVRRIGAWSSGVRALAALAAVSQVQTRTSEPISGAAPPTGAPISSSLPV
jgi:hypothetical protein